MVLNFHAEGMTLRRFGFRYLSGVWECAGPGVVPLGPVQPFDWEGTAVAETAMNAPVRKAVITSGRGGASRRENTREKMMPYYWGDKIDRVKIDDISTAVIALVIFLFGFICGCALIASW